MRTTFSLAKYGFPTRTFVLTLFDRPHFGNLAGSIKATKYQGGVLKLKASNTERSQEKVLLGQGSQWLHSICIAGSLM